MHLGYFQLGDHVPLTVQCTAGDVAVAPTSCPSYRIYKDAATSTTATGDLPIIDKAGVTGLFGDDLFLGGEFSSGWYTVRYTWVSSGTTRSAMDTFNIADGGDYRGTPVAMHFFEQRGQSHIVVQTDGGVLWAGRNPVVQ